MKRNPVNKKSSAKSFKKSHSKVKKINVAPPPLRGGYRL
jgi:hypothetical protein